MSLLLVYADAVPTEIANALDMSGNAWKAVASVESVERLNPAEGWAGAMVLPADFEQAWTFCRYLRDREEPISPIMFVLHEKDLHHLSVADDLFDDFVLLPLRPGELETRLGHTMWRFNGGTKPELIEYGALLLNLGTYQAAVAGRPLDMTYMEYELLKYFATNPGRVFSREELLRRVWGYEYYGGARTVDVHVRRLRAKLGEEHAQLIQTVRSVGYIFGRSRWNG